MPRLKLCLHVAAVQSGLAYIALWAITFLVLDYGPLIFDGACRPVGSQLFFYWSCEASSPLAFAASIANTALATTVWAPISLAAATMRPDAFVLAIPILLVHLIGLSAALLLAIRLMVRIVDAPRRLRKASAQDGDNTMPPLRTLAPAPRSAPKVKPRDTFGLRGAKS
jgi:hypothetical protein